MRRPSRPPLQAPILRLPPTVVMDRRRPRTRPTWAPPPTRPPRPGSAKQSGTAGVPKTVAKNSAVSATPAKQSATARSGTAVPNGAAGSSGPATHVESSAVAATGGATTSSATPSALPHQGRRGNTEILRRQLVRSLRRLRVSACLYDVGAASSAHTVKGAGSLAHHPGQRRGGGGRSQRPYSGN